MFIEYGAQGQILAAYVEEQYPGQKWLPPSDEDFQHFMKGAPQLVRDEKGRNCLRAVPIKPLPSRQRPGGPSASAEVDHALATQITIALYDYSPDQPIAWGPVITIADAVGVLRRGRLKQVLEKAQAEGLLRVRIGRWAMLTDAGRRAAELSGHVRADDIDGGAIPRNGLDNAASRAPVYSVSP